MYEWENYFEPHILERGWRYARSGAVQHIIRKKDVIEAVVEGTEYYKVKINYDGRFVLDAYCSCPYAADGNYCKHMAAVLYEIDDDGKDDYEFSEKTFWLTSFLLWRISGVTEKCALTMSGKKRKQYSLNHAEI